MIISSFKFYAFLIVLITCVTFINGLRKRDKFINKEETALDSEKKENEIVSTMESIIKEMEEEADKELEKDEKELMEKEEKEVENVESKDAVTEMNILENKDEDDKEKEAKEETEKEETENEESEKEESEKEESEKEESEKEESEKEEKESDKDENTETDEKSESEPEEKEEISSSDSPKLVTEESFEKEKGPEDTFVVWNGKGKVCILARFHIGFSIAYSSKGGEQKAEVRDLKHGVVKGKCDSTSKSRLLQISWGKYVYTMVFNKTEEDNWIVTSMELTYDTSDSLFDGATNPGKKTARSKPLSLYETSVEKSFFCPGEEVVLMYSGNKHVVTARMKEVHLQPYGVEDGKFSPAERCSKVVIDGPGIPYIQDETVPLAVGCTLALIVLLILLGFSFHRAYNAAKVDCNTME